jgi:sarcosine oxidase subunit beta
MRATVVGAGVVGCALGLELRRHGFDVTVVDKNGDVGHGSTAASCGIVRRFYSQPGMIAMAHEAAHVWADWDSFLGPIDDERIVFHRPGMLFIPPRVDEAVRATVEEMTKLGIRASILTPGEVVERFPFLDVSSFHPPRRPEDPEFFAASGSRIEGAVLEEDAGYVVFPALAAQNLRLAGEREGVRFLLNRQVKGIRKVDASGFVVEATRGPSIESEVVVNVSGPHSAVVNRLAGVTLPLETRPLRREVHTLPNPLDGEDDGAALPVVGDLNSGVYFRPESGGRNLIVGSTDPECDELEFLDDPDDLNRSVTEEYWERQTLRAMRRFPRVGRGPARGVADLYDVTVRDWYPIVDRTELPGYYVCVGTSGSSFKTAPILAMLLTRIIETCEDGGDTDREPIRLPLPRIGVTVDAGFLSRLRGRIETSGTVIG